MSLDNLMNALDNSMYKINNSINELSNTIRREVYGNYGGWCDDVGRSYLYYSSSLENISNALHYEIKSLNDIENSLNSIKTDLEKNEVLSLIKEVNAL